MSYLTDEDQCWRCKICGELLDNCWQVCWDHVRMGHQDVLLQYPDTKPEDWLE